MILNTNSYYINRSIVEGASTLMSRRAMQWDMSYLHPGLNLRIGPTLSSNGVLEFVMDPRIRDREIIDHEPSTGECKLILTVIQNYLL